MMVNWQTPQSSGEQTHLLSTVYYGIPHSPLQLYVPLYKLSFAQGLCIRSAKPGSRETKTLSGLQIMSILINHTL